MALVAAPLAATVPADASSSGDANRTGTTLRGESSLACIEGEDGFF